MWLLKGSLIGLLLLWWVSLFSVLISWQYISTSEGKLTLQERKEALRNISGICEEYSLYARGHKYYINGRNGVLYKYADHIHCYFSNMVAVLFSTLLSAAKWVGWEAWINQWGYVHYFTSSKILSLFHFIVWNYYYLKTFWNYYD